MKINVKLLLEKSLSLFYQAAEFQPSSLKPCFAMLIVTLVACFSHKRNPHYTPIKTHFAEETQPLFLATTRPFTLNQTISW